MKKTVLLILVLCTSFAFSQKNQFDAQGNSHGFSTKNFDKTNEPRYQGSFNHGKEIGTFKFYRLNKSVSVLSATREFNADNDIVIVTFFSSKGTVISKGNMKGKLFIGKWEYFHKASKIIMTIEHYNNKGELHGEKLVMYKNGQVAEKANYVNGKEDGLSVWYSDKGVVLKEFNYVNDELHGLVKYYNAKGQLVTKGHYKKDIKDGVWKYYKNGKLVEEKTFPIKKKKPTKKQ
jgi:antitoxin component YwqK of YwqJK toxin-antitoxin module